MYKNVFLDCGHGKGAQFFLYTIGGPCSVKFGFCTPRFVGTLRIFCVYTFLFTNSFYCIPFVAWCACTVFAVHLGTSQMRWASPARMCFGLCGAWQRCLDVGSGAIARGVFESAMFRPCYRNMGCGLWVLMAMRSSYGAKRCAVWVLVVRFSFRSP